MQMKNSAKAVWIAGKCNQHATFIRIRGWIIGMRRDWCLSQSGHKSGHGTTRSGARSYVLQTDKEGNLLDVMIDQRYERDDWRWDMMQAFMIMSLEEQWVKLSYILEMDGMQDIVKTEDSLEFGLGGLTKSSSPPMHNYWNHLNKIQFPSNAQLLESPNVWIGDIGASG